MAKLKKSDANKKYPDFFQEADKVMSKESIARAEIKAEELLLNQRLAELREELGVRQTAVKGFSQPGISKIESGSDIKVSTMLEYLRGIGCGLEINAIPLDESGQRRPRKKTLLKAS